MKRKRIFIIVILTGLILAGAGLGGYLVLQSPIELLSPFSNEVPDLSGKISQKVTPDFTLNLVGVKTLESLEKLPRYLVYDFGTHQVFYAKNPTEKFAPASLTKLLSMQVALDLSASDSLLTATKESVDKEPTVLGLKPGEQFPLSDLLRGAIATSGNDAAQTVAESVSSQNGISITAFIDLMNRKAQLLKMTDSHFETVDGLDGDTQVTTLVDLAKLVENTLTNYPEIASAAASDRQDILPTSTHGHYYLSNWNGLLGVYPGVDGLKIGYTEKAKHTTIVTAIREGRRIVAIVSGADSYQERDLAAAALLDAGFMAHSIAPARITLTQIKRRYKVWDDLIKKTRAELESLRLQVIP